MTEPLSITEGLCESDCPAWRHWVWISIECLFGVLCFVHLGTIPAVMIQLTPRRYKALQQALQIVLTRVFGSLPGVLLLGWVKDQTCLLWERENGQRGSCSLYDTTLYVSMTTLAGK